MKVRGVIFLAQGHTTVSLVTPSQPHLKGHVSNVLLSALLFRRKFGVLEGWVQKVAPGRSLELGS